MILHTALFAAFIVDQAQPAQCVYASTDSPWKWIIQSVIPVAGGTLIAVWSFVQNRTLEQKQWDRNQKAAHKQWILDQKKAEWSGLLRATAEVQRVLRIVNTPNKERIERIVDELKPAVHDLSVASANCFFLQSFFAEPAKREKFYSFIKDADDTSEIIGGLRTVYRYPDFTPTQQESSDLIARILNETGRITVKYLEFNEWLRKEASEDLGVDSSEKSAG